MCFVPIRGGRTSGSTASTAMTGRPAAVATAASLLSATPRANRCSVPRQERPALRTALAAVFTSRPAAASSKACTPSACRSCPVKAFGTIQRLAFGPTGTPQPGLADPRGPAPACADQPLGTGQPSDVQHVPLIPIGGIARAPRSRADHALSTIAARQGDPSADYLRLSRRHLDALMSRQSFQFCALGAAEASDRTE